MATASTADVPTGDKAKKKSLKGMLNAVGGNVRYQLNDLTKDGYERRFHTIEYTPPPPYTETVEDTGKARRRCAMIRISERTRQERLLESMRDGL